MSILSEKKIFSNQVFNVNSCHVRDAKGNEIADYLVVEPKIHDNEFVNGVAVIPYADNRIGCISIYRPALRRISLEIPHGFVDHGETFLQACQRELMEETGIICKPAQFEFLCSVAPDSGVIRGVVKLFCEL